MIRTAATRIARPGSPIERPMTPRALKRPGQSGPVPPSRRPSRPQPPHQPRSSPPACPRRSSLRSPSCPCSPAPPLPRCLPPCPVRPCLSHLADRGGRVPARHLAVLAGADPQVALRCTARQTRSSSSRSSRTPRPAILRSSTATSSPRVRLSQGAAAGPPDPGLPPPVRLTKSDALSHPSARLARFQARPSPRSSTPRVRPVALRADGLASC